MTKETTKDTVFTIRMENEVYKKINDAANARNTSTADLIRQFIRLGMIAISNEKDSPKLVLKDGDTYRHVLLV